MDNTGCVVFLVDESAAMSSPVGGGTKSKSDSVATAINSLITRLGDGPECQVAIVGYRSDAEGEVEVGCRFAGDLAGRDFVPTGELAGSPLEIEQRTRKIPGPAGTFEEEPVEFPVWYRPDLGEKAPQIAAYQFCEQLLTSWAGSVAPLVVNITSGASDDGNPSKAVRQLQSLDFGGNAPIVMQAHLSSSSTVPPTLYPSKREYLKVGQMRYAFDRASELPESFAAALKEKGITINKNARAMVYGAKMVDLSQLLSTIQTYIAETAAAEEPEEEPEPVGVTSDVEPAEDEVATVDDTGDVTGMEEAVDEEEAIDEDTGETAETYEEPASTLGPVTPETPAVLALLLDRSVDDPYSGNLQNAWAKLQESANDLLGNVVKEGGGCVDTLILSYGADASDEIEIRNELEGRLDEGCVVRDDRLEEAALRIDEFVEEIPDGVGGLLEVPRRRPILVESEAAAAAPAAPAFAEVARLLGEWCESHPECNLPPIVLHLTRGALDATDVDEAAAHLSIVSTSGGSALLYHLVSTEDPHAGLAYPDMDDQIEGDSLRALWQSSSPLLSADQLAAENPSLSAEARGFVVNGKFDLLLAAVKRAMQ